MDEKSLDPSDDGCQTGDDQISKSNMLATMVATGYMHQRRHETRYPS